MTNEATVQRSQAEISQSYTDSRGRRVAVVLGDLSLDHLTALGITDSTNIGTQIRRAVDEYVTDRLQDPSLPDQVEHARNRFVEYLQINALDLLSQGPPAGSVPDQERQRPETD